MFHGTKAPFKPEEGSSAELEVARQIRAPDEAWFIESLRLTTCSDADDPVTPVRSAKWRSETQLITPRRAEHSVRRTCIRLTKPSMH